MKIKKTRLTKTIFWAYFIFLLLTGAAQLPADENRSAKLFSTAGINEQTTDLSDAKVIRSRIVKVNVDLLCQLETTYNAQVMSGDLKPTDLNLFDDVNFSVHFDEIEKTFSGGTSYVGYIEGMPAGEVVMVRTEGILSGNINTGERLYQIKYLAGDLHQINEIQPGSYPSELPPVPIHLDPVEPADEKINEVLDTGNYIDVMVLYTSTARSAEGGTTAMGNLIDLAVTETNTGYANSGVTQRLRLVHTAEVSYSETGFDWDITLDRLQGETDGYMDNIHTLRDTYGADEVVLIVNASDYCGLGYLMSTLSSSFESWAFCLVSRYCVSGYYSFAHELGHNMGSHHDRANVGSSHGVYNYSYGYQAPNEAFRTIMAYDCPGGCPRVNYWSNPDKTYGGQAMGVIYTATNAADNRRSLNNTLSTVRNFRQAQTSSSSITVVSPNGGETWAAGSTQTINWTSSGSIANVKIEYSTNNGSTWISVISSTANDGSHSWKIPSVSSTQCKIRIKEAASGTPSDTSNAVFAIVSASTPTITVTSPNGGEKLSGGASHTITWSTTGTVGNVKIQYSTNNGSSWSNVVTSTANDGSHKWTVPSVNSSQCRVKIFEASDSKPIDTSNNVFTITASTAPKIALNRTQFYFGALRSASKTGGQTLRIDNSGGGTLSWSISSSTAWLSGSPTSGTGAGVVTLNVNHNSLAAGTYTGTITIAASGASNTPRTISVNLTVKNASSDQYPFGEFASPTNGSYVSSSIPVTGWVLDDIDVASVKIYNGSTYIGDAVFVEGARPDVASAYSSYPKNYQAGWGYMLLSHFLPNGGNGTYTLYAKATDSAGHVTTLGSKIIYCYNYYAVKPFGAIDTPAQGGTASGSNFYNFGWVLTPQPNTIPTNGSTVEIYIDSVKKGTATYNQYRSDIASLFPGYKNTNGAGASFKFNTTAYSNGVHSIFWIVTDNGGNADGIGSRYFIVQNTGADMKPTDEPDEPLYFPTEVTAPPSPDIALNSPVIITKGYRRDAVPQTIYPDNGILHVTIHELERIVINFGSPLFATQILPVGSTLDSKKGIFYWNPGPGFIGDYQLQFTDHQSSQVKQVNIKILPKQ